MSVSWGIAGSHGSAFLGNVRLPDEEADTENDRDDEGGDGSGLAPSDCRSVCDRVYEENECSCQDGLVILYLPGSQPQTMQDLPVSRVTPTMSILLNVSRWEPVLLSWFRENGSRTATRAAIRKHSTVMK